MFTGILLNDFVPTDVLQANRYPRVILKVKVLSKKK